MLATLNLSDFSAKVDNETVPPFWKFVSNEALWEIETRANKNGLGASIQETWRLIHIEGLSAEKMQLNQLIFHDFKSSFIKLKLRFSEERNNISIISLKSWVGFA